MNKKYEELREKFGLPEYERFNKNFEIEECKPPLLKKYRIKITEKLSEFIKILDSLIEPDDFVSLHEIKKLTDKDKEEILKLYSSIMYLIRTSHLISLDNDDKQTAEFINNVSNQLPNLKKQIRKFIKMMKDSWTLENIEKEEINYLG